MKKPPIGLMSRSLQRSLALLLTTSLSLFNVGVPAFAASGSVIGNISVSPDAIDCGQSTTVTMNLTGQNGITQNPVDVELVLDTSGSMQGTPFTNLKVAANKFIDVLDKGSDGVQNGVIGNGSRIGIVSFDSIAFLKAPLTNNANQLKGTVNSLSLGGNTNHGAAFQLAQQQLSATGTNKKILVMFTDGETNVGPQPGPIATNIKAAGIEIYTIGLGAVNTAQLNSWASEPDSTHVFITPSSSQLETTFQGLGAAIVSQAASDISINNIVNSNFTISNVSATKGSATLSGNGIEWTIDSLGGETVTLTYTITNNGLADGAIPVSDSITYTDHEGQNVSFGNPVVSVGSCDNQAPVTEAELSGQDQDGWYNQDVTVTLNATDDKSGVEKTEYKVNDGDWQTYQTPFAVTGEGVNTVQFKSTDRKGNVEEAKFVTVKMDKTAPTTTVSPLGGGWHNTDVSLTLEASDGLSRVAKTEYQINDGNWQTYQGPFDITAEGENVVNYRSIDYAGNVEAVKNVTVKIDKTAPILNVSFNPSVLTDRNHKLIPIKATVNGQDTLSGIDKIELVSIESNQPDNGKGDGNTVNDIQEASFGTFDTEFLLRAERSGSGDRIYTITYKAYDQAGNFVIKSQEIIVTHDNSNK